MITSKESIANLTGIGHGSNVQFDEASGYCKMKLNAEIYPVEAVQFAGHHMADVINIIINTEPGGKILAELFLKNDKKGNKSNNSNSSNSSNNDNIRDTYWKFNETLLGYTVYLAQSNRNKALREAILKKALSVPVENA